MARPPIQVAVGDRYHMLTVVRETEPEPRPLSPSRYRRFEMRCDCGELTNVRLCNVRSGSTRSCGCLIGIVQRGRLRRAG